MDFIFQQKDQRGQSTHGIMLNEDIICINTPTCVFPLTFPPADWYVLVSLMLERPPLCRRAFTLIELLAVVAIILILAAVLVPFASKMLDRANGVKCLANLKTIGIASAAYSGDHRGNWPASQPTVPFFTTSLIPYLGRIPGTKDADFLNSPLICPGARTDRPDGNYSYQGFYTLSYSDPETGKTFKYGLSYGQNVYAPGGAASSAVPNRMSPEQLSKMMLYMDNEAHHVVSIGGLLAEDRTSKLLKRHGGNINVAYADGSVRSLRFEDIPTANSPIRQFWSGKGLP